VREAVPLNHWAFVAAKCERSPATQRARSRNEENEMKELKEVFVSSELYGIYFRAMLERSFASDDFVDCPVYFNKQGDAGLRLGEDWILRRGPWMMVNRDVDPRNKMLL
jgi:hypothetical protein